MKQITRRNISADTCGFSTTFDVLLFLMMVSVCAVILLPTITGSTQIRSALESRSQKQSSEVLLTLLNGRVDDFEYSVAGNQMDAIAGPFRDTSIYTSAKKMIAEKELKHRTFSDIAAENAASVWFVYHNGKKIQLNFMMTNYSDSTDYVISNYLDRQIGDRYNYNFTVIWHPFVNVPVGGDVSIGPPVPENAYIESTYITMPYHTGFTRKRVEKIIDNSFNGHFGNISSYFEELKKNGTNRTQVEGRINKEIFEAMNRSIDDAVIEIVNSTIAPALDNATNVMVDEVSNSLPPANDSLCMELKDRINQTLVEEGAHIADTVSTSLTAYLQDVVKQETYELAHDEIKALVTDLADMYVAGAISIYEVRDRILTNVFTRININRAQATLSLWERNV